MMPNYAHGHNVPGFIPDNPAFVCESFHDAKQAVLWDMQWFADYAETDDEANAFALAAEDVNLWSATDRDQDWYITAGGRAFWIHLTDEDADIADSMGPAGW